MKKRSALLFIVAILVITALSMIGCNTEIVKVTEVTLDKDILSLVVDTDGMLVATVLPDNAADKALTWSSADALIATVDTTGKVTAVAVGTTVVTVTTVDGAKTATCEIIVTAAPVAVTGMTFNKSTQELSTDGKFQLKAVFSPREATNSNVTSWASSNPAVATIGANGWVTAVAVGTTAITASSEEGSFEATCNVTVIQRSNNVLVVGYSPFSSKFSPFFSKTAYDQDVASMTQLSLLTMDRQGNLILGSIDGETVSYNDTDYTYTGIADFVITPDGTDTIYDITIRDDIEFSDGEDMTIDDVIFSMYVLSDPLYTGSSTLYATKIKGMDAYRTNNQDMSAEASTYMEDAAAIVAEVEAETLTYDTMTVAQQEVIDWCIDNAMNTSAWSSWAYNYTIDDYKSWGYGSPEATDEEVYLAVATDEILGGFYEDYAPELEGMKAIQLAVAYVETHPEAEVKSIDGISRTGDYSMRVVTEGFEATTIYQLGIAVAPLHYYGSEAKYDYNNFKYGFDKGDLSSVEAKTTSPMGAGAYKFNKFENGIVTFDANPNYYKGAPKISQIQFRETSDADKVSGILAGTFDVTDPSFSASAVAQVKGGNSNTELTGDKIMTSLVDNLGYGYIGINASRVKVGSDTASAASKNFRKAYATLFASYRDVVVNSYYEDRAAVINYPISNTSWAAPQPSDDDYKVAYSNDKDGNPIYTTAMTADQKYAAALDAAKNFLIAAGFNYSASTGLFTDVPQLTAHIPADGTGDHPSFGILTYVKAALETIGVTLNITDYADANNFWPVLEGNQCDIWCAAWGATVDPDMYQVYHSSNAIGAGGTDSNHYNIIDATLDAKMIEARESSVQATRKALYKECLDIILDWGVEVPTYQRKNAVIFSSSRVDLDTLTPDITTFWGWMNDIENIEMN